MGWARDGVAAGAVAAVVSGIPSTVHALATGRDPLEATLAAGALVLPNETRRSYLLLAAAPIHVAISLGWGLVLARVLSPRSGIGSGAGAGLAIAAFDLGVVGSHFPRIHALPLVPQTADHLLYGATVAAVLSRRRA
jgi:hypothetical protein